MTDGKKPDGAIETPDLTIVGGQPKPGQTRRRTWRVDVPKGIEIVLHRASKDEAFRASLGADREAALASSGIPLTATEAATLRAAPDGVLQAMITNLAASGWKRSPLMRIVAATAATLAAGTAVAACAPAEEPAADAGVDVRFNSDAGVVDGGPFWDRDVGITDADVDVATDADAAVDAGSQDSGTPGDGATE